MGNRNLLTMVMLVAAGLSYQTAGPSRAKPSDGATPAAASGTRLSSGGGKVEPYLPGKVLLERSYQKNIVALVPDPIRTRLSLSFDRVVDSMIGAASDSGFTLQTYFLPWERSPFTATDDPSLRSMQQAENDARKKLPGIMVFTRNDELNQLAIFLVAESPTKGVDQSQFSDALSRIHTPYDVLGPTFSGSLPSLASLLPAQNLPRRVITTGVTGKAQADVFRKRFGSDLRFRTTLYDDEFAWDKFRESLGNRAPRLARLSESETAFGASLPGGIPIRFPRGISQVRNAYQDAVPTAGEKTPYKMQAEGLPLLLKDPAQVSDTVPTFGAGQTALSEEALLGQVGRLLREERVELAHVSATDVFDALFVSKYLRTACPNVRLAFLDSDLLYTRAAEDLPFAGLLSISQYPLLPLYSQDKPAPSHALFSSVLAEAAYDAARSILTGFPSKGRCQQPLWLTTVGRDGYWPVARLAEGSGGCDIRSLTDEQFRKEIEKPRPTVAVRNAMLLFYVVCLLWCGVLAFAQVSRWNRMADFRLIEDRCSLAQRIAQLLTVTLALRTLCVLVSAPVETLGLELQSLNAIALLAKAALLVWALLLSFALLIVGLQRLNQSASSLALGLVSWSGYVLLQIGWSRTLGTQPDMAGFFSAWRSMDFASGVAPVVPLLLLMAGVGYWAWTQHQRYIFIDERRQTLDFGESDPLWKREIAPAYKRLCDYLHRDWYVNAIAVAVTALLMWRLWMTGIRPLRSLEPVAFDVLFRSLLAVFFGLMILMLFQFFMTWSRLRAFLVRVEYHPVREGLSLLPSDHSWSPIWQFSARRRNYSHLVRASDALVELKLTDNRLPERLGAIFAEHAEGRRETQCQWHDVTQEFSKLQAIVAGRVAEYWKRRTSESVQAWEARDSVKDSAKLTQPAYALEKPSLLEQEFLALRYVAFIRYVMLHLRNMLEFLSTGFMLAALSLNSYPFQAPRLLGWWVMGAFVGIGLVILLVLVEMNRDPVLSRISNTKAHELDRHFFLQIAEVGALPLLALVSTNVPSVSRFLFSWVEPALAAFH